MAASIVKVSFLLICGVGISIIIFQGRTSNIFFLKKAWTTFDNPSSSINGIYSKNEAPVTHHSNDTSLKQHICPSDDLKNILVVIMYSVPEYDSLPLLKEFYKPAFEDFYVCGEKPNSTYGINTIVSRHGIWGYYCLTRAIKEFPEYKGYLFINDDVILNWWNLIGKYDVTKIWQSNHYFRSADADGDIPGKWYWWVSPYGFNQSVRAIDEVRSSRAFNQQFHRLYKTFLLNGKRQRLLHSGRSDILYIPGKHSRLFYELAEIFYKHWVTIEIAVPTILRFLTEEEHLQTLNGYYIPGNVQKNDSSVIDSRYFWMDYFSRPATVFIHPFKLHHKGHHNRELNLELLKRILIRTSKEKAEC